MAAKKRKKNKSRAMKPSVLAKFRASSEYAAKNVRHQGNAFLVRQSLQAQRNHTADVSKLAPMVCPMDELVAAARAGDANAVWRATELFGNSWRVKRRAVA